MIKMPDNVLAFAERTQTKDLFVAFSDLWNHYRYMTQKIDVPFEKEISFEDKSRAMNESLKKEIAKIAGVSNFSVIPEEVWVTNPTYKWATFAVIGALVDMVLPDTIIDSIGLYTDVRTGGFGDNFAFDVEPNDLFYVTKSGRGKRHAEAQKSFNGQVIVTPVEHDIAVSVNLYRVLSGKENLAAFAMKAVRSLETEMAYDAYSAFDTAMAAVPATSNYELYYSGWSESNVIKLTDKVSSYNNGVGRCILLGTRTAVASVLPSSTSNTSANYRINLPDDYVKIGYLREFYGCDVVVLPQKANWKTPYAGVIDDTRIYVLAPGVQKPVKLCIEGSTLSIADGIYDGASLESKTTMKKMYATGVCSNSTYGMIELS